MNRILLAAPLLFAFAVPAAAQPGRFPGGVPGGARDAALTVRGWYERFLGRQPDVHALAWIQALRSGQDPNAVLSSILGSDEYYLRTGNNPPAFVRTLYRELNGRPPTPREEAFWVRQIYSRSRADIAFDLLTRPNQNWDPTPDPQDYRPPFYRYR